MCECVDVWPEKQISEIRDVANPNYPVAIAVASAITARPVPVVTGTPIPAQVAAATTAIPRAVTARLAPSQVAAGEDITAQIAVYVRQWQWWWPIRGYNRPIPSTI